MSSIVKKPRPSQLQINHIKLMQELHYVYKWRKYVYERAEDRNYYRCECCHKLIPIPFGKRTPWGTKWDTNWKNPELSWHCDSCADKFAEIRKKLAEEPVKPEPEPKRESHAPPIAIPLLWLPVRYYYVNE